MLVAEYSPFTKTDAVLLVHDVQRMVLDRAYLTSVAETIDQTYTDIIRILREIDNDIDAVQNCGDADMFDCYVDMLRERVESLRELIGG